jgi:alkanesulfonate monooxygenase SsuD/methylene tetrahydromethanopterin reductase-like flavin-dependent oxidoreductase (luciferase family)
MADQSPLPLPANIGVELVRLDSRNVAGEVRSPNVGGRLPTTFIGCPDTVIAQIKRCREEAGVGVLDLFFQTAEAAPEAVIDKLTMFGNEVLPRIRDI